MRAELLRAARFAAAHLEERLDTARLAEIAGSSPAHFHRRFHEATGETPAHFVERLRLERGARRLRTHSGRVLDAAIECGYASADAFARAFRRRYGCSPRQFRHETTDAATLSAPERYGPTVVTASSFELGSARKVEVAPFWVARRRLRGAYEDAWASYWRELLDAVSAAGGELHQLFGVGHDDPGETVATELRFDVAGRIREPLKLPPPLECARIAGGPHVVISFAGPLQELTAAYPEIYRRAMTLAQPAMPGLPVMESYQSTLLGEILLQHIDVYMPLAIGENEQQ